MAGDEDNNVNGAESQFDPDETVELDETDLEGDVDEPDGEEPEGEEGGEETQGGEDGGGDAADEDAEGGDEDADGADEDAEGDKPDAADKPMDKVRQQIQQEIGNLKREIVEPLQQDLAAAREEIALLRSGKGQEQEDPEDAEFSAELARIGKLTKAQLADPEQYDPINNPLTAGALARAHLLTQKQLKAQTDRQELAQRQAQAQQAKAHNAGIAAKLVKETGRTPDQASKMLADYDKAMQAYAGLSKEAYTRAASLEWQAILQANPGTKRTQGNNLNNKPNAKPPAGLSGKGNLQAPPKPIRKPSAGGAAPQGRQRVSLKGRVSGD